MRRTLLPALALVALLSARDAGGGTTGALEPLREAVLERRMEYGVFVGRPPASVRALDRSLGVLDRARDRVEEELRDAARVCHWLDRSLPGDPSVDPALADALAALDQRVLDDRAALLARLGRAGSDRGERILERRILAVDRRHARALAMEPRWKRTRAEGGVSRLIRRTRERLGFDDPVGGPPPFEGVAPDFALLDANPASATSGEEVSPRDFQGNLSAYYFTRAT